VVQFGKPAGQGVFAESFAAVDIWGLKKKQITWSGTYCYLFCQVSLIKLFGAKLKCAK
jgi:hypothetical protein